MNHATYSVEKITDSEVFIRDQCIGRSVTNDAERVVVEVNANWPDHRIFYCDTMGVWDELVHESGKFVRFAPGNGRKPW